MSWVHIAITQIWIYRNLQGGKGESSYPTSSSRFSCFFLSTAYPYQTFLCIIAEPESTPESVSNASS